MFEDIATAKWLARVTELHAGLRPVIVEKGSSWRTPIAGVLLGADGLVLLEAGAVDGAFIALRDVTLANIVEDSKEQYTMELRTSGEGAPPATLVFADDLFFMLVFAALANAGVQCEFGFTQRRLKELGAQDVAATPGKS